MSRVGVLGGTFDPPHLAHLVLAAAARRALRLDRVVLVPAGQPWRKADRAVTPAALRLRMIEVAVRATLPWAEVSAIEVERGGPTYTVETLEALAAQQPGSEWWFVLGADALADLPNWHEPERLVARARLGLAQRALAPPEAPGFPGLPELPGLAERLDVVSMPPLTIAASELRRRVRRGLSTAPLLPAAVRRLVDELGLYREP